MPTLEELSKQCISVCQVPVDVSREFIVEHIKRQFQGGGIVDTDKVDGIESGQHLTRLVLLCTALEDVDHMCKEVKEEEIEFEGKRFTVKYQTAVACELPERWENFQIQEQVQQIPGAGHQNSHQYAWPPGLFGAMSGFYHNIPDRRGSNTNKGGMKGHFQGQSPMPGNEQQQCHDPLRGQGHGQGMNFPFGPDGRGLKPPGFPPGHPMFRMQPLDQNNHQGAHNMQFLPRSPMMFDHRSGQWFPVPGFQRMPPPTEPHRHSPGNQPGPPPPYNIPYRRSTVVKSPRGGHTDDEGSQDEADQDLEYENNQAKHNREQQATNYEESFQLKMEVSGKKADHVKCYSRSEAGEHPQIYCDPCCKDGIRLTAHGFCQDCMEHLCESCYKTHRKPAPCRNHVLLDKTQMPKSPSADHLKVPHDLTQQCQLHKGKLIEYICHDHNILGCSPCITLNHRNCKIDYIPDVSKEYRTSDEYRELLRSLAALQKQFKTLIENTKANKKKIMKNKYLVKDEIKKFRQEINIMFDKLEANLQKNADDIFAKESARMESLASRSVKLEKDIKLLQNDISNLEMANQCNALYIRSKENKEIIQSYTSAEKQAHKDNYVNSFVFTPNVNLKEILGSKVGIGELQNSDIVRNVRTDAGYFETLHVKYSDEINVKSPSDEIDS